MDCSSGLIYRGPGILHQLFTDTGGCYFVPASEDAGVLNLMIPVEGHPDDCGG